MFDHTIRGLLAMFPRGATDDQLIWRLAASGIRVTASEILAGLTDLAERGEILRDATGRWRAVETTSIPPSSSGTASGRAGGRHTENVLYAVVGICSAQRVSEPVTLPAGPAAALPDWSALVSYYAATQRKDPRGRILEFADRHGSGWQLFSTIGNWWRDASIRIAMQDVPELLREALVRRTTTTAAIGWPVSVFPSSDGTAFIPGLILPVEFRVAAESLHLEVEAADPVVNPDWLREIRRHANWTESDLLERLFPEGEETDLGAVSNRMRHLLATIGGGSLRPGELASELSQNGKGLRNAAGLFLPEESSFTKAAADDLDAMRSWSAEVRKQCALDALLSGTAGNQVSSDIPFLPAGAGALLTDSQLDAAQSALNGPLTVIQGPPGTGKSQVILALIVSAVLSGRSVLFAAKNHQAIDEVERRLAAIIPNAPLLTRARSADGERDASFLDALAEIARGDTRALNGEIVEGELSALLERAGTIENAWRKARERERLNLALSELIDRLPAGDEKIERDRRIKLGIWLRRALPLGPRQKPDLAKSLEKQATLRQIKTRIAEIRERLAEFSKTDDSTGFDAAALHSHAKSVADYLPRFAEFITLPDQATWRNLVERARETEFIRTSARRLGAEDARAILRHRPVWAVSTLAAPARMPLIPGLFDYVIFDEASQCDIASALPLFARARKAIVVGDPLQLRFVPQLGNGSEHALMDAAGLPKAGRAMIAQSINSLFDFCETRPAAARKFLSDQFRSAPPIVGYLNADFYAGKLASRRDNESFSPPNGYRPGLDWRDVQGHAQREDGGTINKAEAQHIADAARKLAEDLTSPAASEFCLPLTLKLRKSRSVSTKRFCRPTAKD